MECARLVDIVDGWALASLTGYAGVGARFICAGIKSQMLRELIIS